MTDEADERPSIDPTRHYPETRKRGIPGEWTPWCPRCVVMWPCPTAISEGTTTGGAT